MKVALCFGTFPPERNGGSDYVARLAAELAAGGDDVYVVTSAGGGVAREQLRPGLVIARSVSDWRLTAEGRKSLRAVNSALRTFGADVLHVFFPDSVLQGAYRIPALIGLSHVPLVTTFWNLGLGRRSPPWVRAEALALLVRSRTLSTHEPGYLEAIGKLVVRRKAVRWLPVGNNLMDIGAGAEAVMLDGAEWLGYFGQLDETRGVEDLFLAVQDLRRVRDVRLVMIGSAGRRERYARDPASSAYLSRMLALPGELGIDRAVVWTDYLPDRRVAAYLRAVDLCVLPYRQNSIGRSALVAAFEAHAAVVLAGTPETIAPLQAGRHVELVPPAAPAQLSATIARLLSDRPALAQLRDGAAEAAMMFSWPEIARRARAIYAEAAAAKASAT